MSLAEILATAWALTPSEEKELDDLLRERHAVNDSQPKRSLFELRGIGMGIWQGVDIDAYINEMRDEWDRER